MNEAKFTYEDYVNIVNLLCQECFELLEKAKNNKNTEEYYKNLAFDYRHTNNRFSKEYPEYDKRYKNEIEGMYYER